MGWAAHACPAPVPLLNVYHRRSRCLHLGHVWKDASPCTCCVTVCLHEEHMGFVVGPVARSLCVHGESCIALTPRFRAHCNLSGSNAWVSHGKPSCHIHPGMIKVRIYIFIQASLFFILLIACLPFCILALRPLISKELGYVCFPSVHLEHMRKGRGVGVAKAPVSHTVGRFQVRKRQRRKGSKDSHRL